MRKRAAFLILVSLAAVGCSPDGPEELQRLTKEDPAFRDMIATRDRVNGEIKAIKADLLDKKNATDAQVEKLRGEYDTYSTAQNGKIDKARAEIDANRTLLKKQIESAEAELLKKEADLEITDKKLATARRILKDSKSYNISPQERENWQERILRLSEKATPLKEAIRELRLQIRLKKRKLAFLR